MFTKTRIRLLTVFTVLMSIAFATACGGGNGGGGNGGGGQTPGTPPTFTSTAPSVASEGETYTYALAATDPQGGTVTFSLQSGPAGAAVSGSTLSWTPTHAQARKENTFTVLATTSHGGSGKQSFTITPTGYIHGTYITTFYGANGQTHVPFDLSAANSIAALVPDNAGNFSVIPGTGTADGTFVISKVPAGFYWLRILPTELFWTDASDFDRGADFATRPPSSPDTPGAELAAANLNITGLDPWTSTTQLRGIVPNRPAGIFFRTSTGVPPSTVIELGATAITMPVPASIGRDIDASLGDRAYLFQFEETPLIGDPPAGYSYFHSFFPTVRSVKTLGPLSLTVDSTATEFDIAGEFTAPNPGSMRAKVIAREFTESVGATSPWAEAKGFGASVALVPDASRLTYSSAVALNGFPLASVAAYAQLPSDVDQGDIQYVNPFPSSWTPVYSAFQMAGVMILDSPEARLGILAETGYTTTTPPSATRPFQAPMSNVREPLINGTSIFTTVTASLPVTLSWSTPTGATPSGYRIYVSELGSFPCDIPPTPSPGENCLPSPIRLAAMVFTSSATVKIPSGILESGHDYVFQIQAISDPAMNVSTAPFRGSWNRATSNVLSRRISIATTGSTTQSITPLAAPSQSQTQDVPFYVMTPEGIRQIGRNPRASSVDLSK